MLEEYLKYLLYEKNYSAHTVSSYANDIGQFIEYYTQLNNSNDIENAEREDIRSWVASLFERQLSARTVCRKLSSVKMFYKYLLKKNIVDANPVTVINPMLIKSLPVFFSEDDIDKLQTSKVMDDRDFEEQRDALIIEILYQTGMRRRELIDMKDKDIDFDRKTIKIFGKRQKERIVPFGEELENQIKQYIECRNREVGNSSGYLFVIKRNGKQLYDKALYDIVKKQLSLITTNEKHSPHTLRHTFATTLLNNGAELNTVKELLGHSSLAATQVYTHISFKELQKQYNEAHPRAKQ